MSNTLYTADFFFAIPLFISADLLGNNLERTNHLYIFSMSYQTSNQAPTTALSYFGLYHLPLPTQTYQIFVLATCKPLVDDFVASCHKTVSLKGKTIIMNWSIRTLASLVL